jgi:hypothetical protein
MGAKGFARARIMRALGEMGDKMDSLRALIRPSAQGVMMPRLSGRISGAKCEYHKYSAVSHLTCHTNGTDNDHKYA